MENANPLVQITVRIPLSLNDDINQQYHTLKAAGKTITKQGFVATLLEHGYDELVAKVNSDSSIPYKDSIEYRDKMKALQLAEGTGPCPGCQEGPSAPSHNGSPDCQSGSIASGGTHAHCSCGTCF